MSSRQQSIMRKIRRGNMIILLNPDSKVIEQYQRTTRGMYTRGGESLHYENLKAKAKVYTARAEELEAITKAEKL